MTSRAEIVAFLQRLASVWPEYRELGYAIAQRASFDDEFDKRLLIDSRLSPGDLARNFTGVREITKVVDNEIEFIDFSGQRFFATVDMTESSLKLVSMKIECPSCFGEGGEPDCPLCDGAGKV